MYRNLIGVRAVLISLEAEWTQTTAAPQGPLSDSLHRYWSLPNKTVFNKY